MQTVVQPVKTSVRTCSLACGYLIQISAAGGVGHAADHIRIRDRYLGRAVLLITHSASS
jgi:hypothetical protein